MASLIARPLVAAAATALLGVAALLTPAPASAGYDNCDPGNFCLYYDATLDWHGGIYHFEVADSNLWNDRFELNHTNAIVAGDAASAWVNGRPAPKDDVIIYRSTGWRGADACIKRGDSGFLPIETWMNKVQSYKWATDAQCRAAGILDL